MQACHNLLYTKSRQILLHVFFVLWWCVFHTWAGQNAFHYNLHLGRIIYNAKVELHYNP